MVINSLQTDLSARGQRIDQWLSHARPEHSRARWQELVRGGAVRVDGMPVKNSHRLAGGETVTWTEPPIQPADVRPEALPLDVLYEDGDILVVNKPPGLVVHPAPGHRGGTLVNALLYHCDDLSGIGGEERPGIVHRLDRDTSGLMVIAKSEMAHRHLADQFRNREISKEYWALVWGSPEPETGTIRTLIGRDERQRKRMTTRVDSGRHAVTHYRTLETFFECSLLELRIETGRTHQIRVHMAHLGHPVMGDLIYGRRKSDNQRLGVPRQMLHARRLCFLHPGNDERLEFESDPPADMREFIVRLRRTDRTH